MKLKETTVIYWEYSGSKKPKRKTNTQGNQGFPRDTRSPNQPGIQGKVMK